MRLKRFAFSILSGALVALPLVFIARAILDAHPHPAPDGERISIVTATKMVDSIQQRDATSLKAQLKKGKLNPSSQLTRPIRNGSSTIFDRLTEIDLPGSLEFANSTWNFEERIKIIRRPIVKWAHRDIDACWEWLESSQLELTEEELTSEAWKNLLRAVLDGRPLSQPSEQEIARTWRELERSSSQFELGAKKQLEAIRGVFVDPSTGIPAGTIWPLVIKTHEKGTWEETFERMLDLPGGVTLYRVITHRWLAHDPDSALEWILDLQDERKRILVESAMLSWEREQPGTPTRWNRDAVFLKLAQRSPEWAQRRLRKMSPEKVSVWLAAMPADSPEYDTVRSQLASNLAQQDVEAAMAWANAIVDERKRDYKLLMVGRGWARFEPWAVARWARENLGWDEEQRARLFESQ